MSGEEKDYRGGAGALALNTGIDTGDTTIQADGATGGWSTGSPNMFVIVIGKGTIQEEKILCNARSGLTFTVEERGYDGTVASAHSVGAVIQHVLDADSLTQFSDHKWDTARDDHTQYLDVNGTRGPDVVDEYVGTPVSVGFGNAEGSADTLARSDHVHAIEDDAVDTQHLADGAVTTPIIDALAVTPAKMAVGAMGGILSQVVTHVGATGAATLATLVIPAQPFAYTLDAAAHWSAYNSTDGDSFDFTIHVGAAVSGRVNQRHVGGTNIRLAYAVPCINPVMVAASIPVTVTVDIVRVIGGGNLTEDTPGHLVVKLYPLDPAP